MGERLELVKGVQRGAAVDRGAAAEDAAADVGVQRRPFDAEHPGGLGRSHVGGHRSSVNGWDDGINIDWINVDSHR